MKIQTKSENGKVTLELEGRLDTNTSLQLEDELAAVLDSTVELLVIDFTNLAYISSAGLRVLLAAQKKMNRQGEMIIRNVIVYTGDKKFFLGSGNLSNPDAIRKPNLNNENSLGKKPCIAYEIEVELESLSEKEIIFMLGAEESIIDSKNIAYKYKK